MSGHSMGPAWTVQAVHAQPLVGTIGGCYHGRAWALEAPGDRARRRRRASGGVMSGRDKEPEEIKVIDRRQFTREGERIAGETPPPESAGASPEPPTQVDPPGASEDVPGGPDFGTLVMSLFNTAMIYLGEIDDPAKEPHPVDLPAAREAIDMLGMLREKTSGNLTPEERHLLDTLLYKLRMDFTQKATTR